MAADLKNRPDVSIISDQPSKLHPTLPASDFYADNVFELERRRIFERLWVCIGREEELPHSGDFLVRDILGECLLFVRDRDGAVRGFYNVCRHRGSRLRDEESGHLPGAIQCPYHAWTYGLDGSLVGTPNVTPADGLDRADFPLFPVAVEIWEGFLFVNLGEDPSPLGEQLGENGTEFARYRIGSLRLGRQNRYDCYANWKILVENYNECLHCPTVHPELCELVPLYNRGLVVEDDGSMGNRLKSGVTTWTKSGQSNLASLPGLREEDLRTYWGFVVFPNLFVNLLPDHVTYELLLPEAPGATRIQYGFLFDRDETAKTSFDPKDIVEFRDLIVRQDLAVCEGAQKGVRSKAYAHGVLPPQDRYVHEFNVQYLRERGPMPGGSALTVG